MSPASLVGATLAFGLGLGHSYLGERYILVRLFRRVDLPRLFGSDLFTRRTLRFAWHLTSVAWWGLGAVLLLTAGGASKAAIGGAIAATFGASGLVTLVGSRGRHLAWPIFLLIAAAAWLATR
jgi:hypothetical protein